MEIKVRVTAADTIHGEWTAAFAGLLIGFTPGVDKKPHAVVVRSDKKIFLVPIGLLQYDDRGFVA